MRDRRADILSNARSACMFERLKQVLRTPEIKASRTAHLLAFESGGRARWTPRDYAALAREGYVGNAIVHRAVKLVAENAASVPYLVYEGATARDTHPLLDLLTRPNPRQEGAAFLESVCAHLMIAGNAYIEAVSIEGTVRELYALRPTACAWCRAPTAGRRLTTTRSPRARCASTRARRCRRSCTCRNSIRSTITMDWRRWKPPR
jgi:phage portal protein BeeE